MQYTPLSFLSLDTGFDEIDIAVSDRLSLPTLQLVGQK